MLQDGAGGSRELVKVAGRGAGRGQWAVEGDRKINNERESRVMVQRITWGRGRAGRGNGDRVPGRALRTVKLDGDHDDVR